MTPQQFQDWFKHLSGRMPSMRTWLSRLDKDARDTMLQLWQYDLQDIPIEHAIAGVDAIYKGTLEEPLPWDRLPVILRKFSASKQDNGSERLLREIRKEKSNRYVPSPDKPTCKEMYDDAVRKLKAKNFEERLAEIP